jgi:hypothetical protein
LEDLELRLRPSIEVGDYPIEANSELTTQTDLLFVGILVTLANYLERSPIFLNTMAEHRPVHEVGVWIISRTSSMVGARPEGNHEATLR